MADDAIFASTGSDKDSVAAEFKDCGVVFRPAQKMQHRHAEGLSIVRSAMAATGRAPDSPWLMWSQHCEAWEATVPGLIKRPRDPTSAPTGNRITSLMHLCNHQGETVLMDGILIAIEGDFARVRINRSHGKAVPGRGAMTGELQLIRRSDVVRASSQPPTLWADRISAVKATAARDGKGGSSYQQYWGAG